LSPPRSDQIQVVVIGPGFGESILIHLGNNCWAIFDSCVDSKSGRPAALAYLRSIDVDPKISVKFILATHWHNDHIGGMSELVEACPSARFSFPLGLNKTQFAEFIELYIKKSTAVDNGVSEIYKTLSDVVAGNRDWTFSLANLPLFVFRDATTGVDTKITALSPSHPDCLEFIAYISSQSTRPDFSVSRVPAPHSNLLSAAAWIEIGERAILLGADLEERRRADTGWSAVLASTTRPGGMASIYKIPHHGSGNGHHGQVWSEMLTADVIAVVTPWTRGRGLPTQQDCNRIDRLASQSFITSTRANRNLRHGQTVTRTLREANIKLRRAEYPTGFVRLTTAISGDDRSWQIECSPEADALARFF
jgi:beta-lactamase superfamily II metal-dependent hydrolase